MEIDKEYTINFDSHGRMFFYKGKLVFDGSDYIEFMDRKLGLIRLNKHNIVSMIPFEGGDF